MDRRFAAVVVVAVFAIVGCSTGQPSGTGPTSPSMAPPSVAAPSMAPTPTTSPPPSPAASTGVAAVHDGPLAAGTYRMPLWDTNCSERQPGCSPSPAHDAMRIMFTVPDGWAGLTGATSSIWLDDIGNAPPDGASLLFGRGA